MPEEICRNLYRIEVPLPDSPLKSLNSYVVKGKDRNLVIDTGFNRKTCLVAMQTGLSALGIDLSRTDFFITHLHADHFGLVSRLATQSSQIFFSRPDAEIMESWEGFEPMIAYAGKHGFPENALRTAIEQHPGNKFGSDWIPALHILADAVGRIRILQCGKAAGGLPARRSASINHQRGSARFHQVFF